MDSIRKKYNAVLRVAVDIDSIFDTYYHYFLLYMTIILSLSLFVHLLKPIFGHCLRDKWRDQWMHTSRNKLRKTRDDLAIG